MLTYEFTNRYRKDLDKIVKSIWINIRKKE